MAKTSWLSVIGLAMMAFEVGCAREMPVSPSDPSAAVLGSASGALTTSPYPAVTLQSDLTVDPAVVTVPVGSKVLMVNNSTRDVKIHSYNCSQFRLIWLGPGDSQHTLQFTSGGKTCDYFAWDSGWSQKIFVGKVVVQ